MLWEGCKSDLDQLAKLSPRVQGVPDWGFVLCVFCTLGMDDAAFLHCGGPSSATLFAPAVGLPCF